MLYHWESTESEVYYEFHTISKSYWNRLYFFASTETQFTLDYERSLPFGEVRQASQKNTTKKKLMLTLGVRRTKILKFARRA